MYLIFYLAILVALFLFLMGPLIYKPAAQMSYSKLLELYTANQVQLRLPNKKLSTEIALSPLYPKKQQKHFLNSIRILRILYFIAIILVLMDKAGYISVGYTLAGIFVFLLALLIRSRMYKCVSRTISEEAIKNQKLYDLIAALEAWTYNNAS